MPKGGEVGKVEETGIVRLEQELGYVVEEMVLVIVLFDFPSKQESLEPEWPL